MYLRAIHCDEISKTNLQRRIDIHIEVQRVEYQKLSSDRLTNRRQRIRERVEAARILN